MNFASDLTLPHWSAALPLADIGSIFLGFLMGGLSLFLILLILIQRGRGGGLTGALGGPGGQSAFGSKAGDTFTYVTIIVATVWGLVCALTMLLYGVRPNRVANDADSSMSSGPFGSGGEDLTGQLAVPSNLSDLIEPTTNDVELVPAETTSDAEIKEMLSGDADAAEKPADAPEPAASEKAVDTKPADAKPVDAAETTP